MIFIHLTYLLLFIIARTKQRSSPVVKLGTKICSSPSIIDYIEFKDTQEEISSSIQPDGKTLSNVRPAVFYLDPCHASGNSDFTSSHFQYITAWVKLESGTHLSPQSTNYINPQNNFLMKTAELKYQEFFGNSGQTAPTNENVGKMMIPTNHQTWIFLIFRMKKIITATEEYAQLEILRSFSDSET